MKKLLYILLFLASISLCSPDRIALDFNSIAYGDSRAYAVVEYCVRNPNGTY